LMRRAVDWATRELRRGGRLIPCDSSTKVKGGIKTVKRKREGRGADHHDIPKKKVSPTYELYITAWAEEIGRSAKRKKKGRRIPWRNLMLLERRALSKGGCSNKRKKKRRGVSALRVEAAISLVWGGGGGEGVGGVSGKRKKEETYWHGLQPWGC